MDNEYLDFNRLLIKVTYVGLFMNVIIPIIIFAATAFLLNLNIETSEGITFSGKTSVKLLFYIFLVVVFIDGVVTYMLRRRLPSQIKVAEGDSRLEKFEKAVMRLSLVIFSFNTSYSIYGLVLVLLGAELEVMMLFMAFSLIGYQLFRPRQKYLEKVYSQIGR